MIIVLDLNGKFDLILILPWLRRYDPRVSWHHRSVKMPASFSSDGHMMNVLESPHACGCTSSLCDDITCGTVVSKTIQYSSIVDHYTMEQAPGDCASAHLVPKVSTRISRVEREIDACRDDIIQERGDWMPRDGKKVIPGHLDVQL